MDTNSLFYQSQYGVSVSAANQTSYRLPSMPTTDEDAVVARTAAEARQLKDYLTPKYFLAGRTLSLFTYFGECTDADGNVIPGTEGKADYPFEIYDDAGNGGYGDLKLWDCKVGRNIVLGGRASLIAVVDNSASGGNGIEDDSSEPLTDFGVGTTTFSTQTWAALTTTMQNIIPTTASDGSGGTCTAIALMTGGTDPTSMTDQTTGTYGTIGLFAMGATILDAHRNTIAGIIANQNRLMEILSGARHVALNGTSTASDFFLNWIVDDSKQDGGADNGLSGYLKLNGVIEIQMLMMGDI